MPEAHGKTTTQRQSPQISLSPAYLRAVERVEQLTVNQSGADKGWVAKSLEAAARHYRRAIRR